MAPAKKKVDAPVAPKGPSALDRARAFLEKRSEDVYRKESLVQIDEESFRESLPHFSSGSIIVDFVIGGKPNRLGVMPCPGFPRGRVIQIYGQASAGKTTLALTASASVIRQGGTVCYIDYENAISIPYAKALGVPIEDKSKFLLYQPDTIEEGESILSAMALSGVDLLVVDSVGEGMFKAERDNMVNPKEDAKGSGLGSHARFWSDKLPGIRGFIGKSGSCLLGISQVRTNIKAASTHGELHIARGGEAWKFGSDIRLYLTVKEKEKGKVYDALTHKMLDKTVALTVKVEVKKSRISASQGMDADFHIRFGEGIDDIQSVIEVSTAHGIIKKGGAWYTWESSKGEIKGCGKEGFRAALMSAEGGWEEMRRGVMLKLAEDASKVQSVVREEEDIPTVESFVTLDESTVETDA